MSLDDERHDELVRVKAENEKLRWAIEVFREGYVKRFGRPRPAA